MSNSWIMATPNRPNPAAEFEVWNDKFSFYWEALGILDDVTIEDRKFYFSNGYTALNAARVCGDVDPTNY